MVAVDWGIPELIWFCQSAHCKMFIFLRMCESGSIEITVVSKYLNFTVNDIFFYMNATCSLL